MKKILSIAFCVSQLFTASVFAQANEDEGYGCLQQIEKRVVKDENFNYLALADCNLQDNDMKIVAGFLKTHTDVNGLQLDNNNELTNSGINELADIHSLTAISLDNIDNVAEGVAKNVALEFVSLNNSDIDSQDVTALASLPNLKVLSLNENYIGNQGAKILAGNPHIQFLLVNNNDIGAKGANALATMPELSGLSINGNFINDEGAVALVKTNRLIILSMESNHIGDKAASALANTANDNFIMILDHNDITDAGAISLANNTNNIFLLNISYNLISDVGVKALTAAQNDGRIFLLGLSGYSEEDMMQNRKRLQEKVKSKLNHFCNKTNYTFCKTLINNTVKA